MDLVPGDQSNMRARMQEQVQQNEARFRARKDVVDAMWNSKRDVRLSQTRTTSAAGAAKLEELRREMGISTAPAAPAPAVKTETEQSARAGGESAS